MARIETDPNYTAPTFSRATAATDPFKKEDVQNLAAAVSTHDHSTGKGVAVPFATAIPNGTITSAMIADGTIDTADLKDGSVTSAKIADGTIATSDLANQSVTNIKLASDTARANLLTNGGFEIWQRGNGPFTANGALFADRWYISTAGSSTISVVRAAGYYGNGNYCANVTYTHNVASAIYQKVMSSSDLNDLRFRAVSFSMLVFASAANSCRLHVTDGVNSAYSAYHPGGSTWVRLTATLPLVNNGAAGSELHARLSLEASGSFQLDDACLVVGSVPADYAPLHPADDLARCLRYYEGLGPGLNFPQIKGIATANGQTFGQSFTFAAKKAGVPTITVAGTFANSNASGGVSPGPAAAGLYFQGTASAAGECTLYSNNSGYLTAEYNP